MQVRFLPGTPMRRSRMAVLLFSKKLNLRKFNNYLMSICYNRLDSILNSKHIDKMLSKMISFNRFKVTNIQKCIDKLFNKPNNVTIREFQLVLEYFGYRLSRVKGSHFIFKSNTGEAESIPVHNNKVKKFYIKKMLTKIYGKY